MSDTSECRGHAKSEFHAAHRLGGVLLVWLLSCACSVHNLSYDQILRDLDATVEVEGSGDDERLVYRTEVEATWGIARWSLMAPFRWFLLPLFGERVDRELENPSAYVRELAGALPVKAGGRLERRAATAQRLVRIAELDPSPRNRIMALEGLAQLASAQGIALTDGLVEFGPEASASGWRGRMARCVREVSTSGSIAGRRGAAGGRRRRVSRCHRGPLLAAARDLASTARAALGSCECSCR